MERQRQSTAVTWYVASIVVLAVLSLVLSELFLSQASRSISNAKEALGLLAFLLFGLGLERAQHRLSLGSASGSIAFVVYLGAAVAFGPAWSAIVAGTSLAVAELLIGKPTIKIVFRGSEAPCAR